MKYISVVALKVLKRISSKVKILIWKILYGKSFIVKNGTIFYPKVHMVIEEKGKVEIGHNCFFNRNCSLNCMNYIKIGDNCLFGENVLIYDHNHNFSKINIPIKKQGYKIKKVIIGDNCWFGSNVCILSGVTVGKNCVIGANSVIKKDVPDNTIVQNVNGISFKERVDKKNE